MNRYQPADQIRNGVQMYGIVDCERNEIMGKSYWFYNSEYRDIEVTKLNGPGAGEPNPVQEVAPIRF